MHRQKSTAGFSLIELAIVLAVIGLVAGGALVTQSLLRSAKTQSVISEFQRYTSATEQFKTRYNGSVPGDMSDASANWVGAANGNGNGFIDEAPSVAGVAGEPFQFWHHLQLADLIDTPYSGVNGTAGGVHLIPGTNVPTAEIENGSWYVGFDAQAVLGATRMFDEGDRTNFFLFAGATSGLAIGAPILTPNEARMIEEKMRDDEIPGTGKVIGIGWNNTCSEPLSGAASSDITVTTRYRASDETRQCMLVFPGAF